MNKKVVMPDLLQLLNSLDTALVYILGGLRVLLFVIGMLWIFIAILNL